MRASLIFSSTSHSINVQKVSLNKAFECLSPVLTRQPIPHHILPLIGRHSPLILALQIFKIVLSKAFDLKCTIPEIENVGEPLLLYQAVN